MPESLPDLPPLPPSCADKAKFVENLTKESNRIAQNARCPADPVQRRKMEIYLESSAASFELDFYKELLKKK
jgi:hypothetical protein